MIKMKNKDLIFPNAFKTSVYLKNIIQAQNILVGNYTYYDCPSGNPLDFEKNNVLFNYEIFGDRLIIGNFTSIAEGVTFIMGAANHRLNSVTTYPFNVFNEEWAKISTPHIDELPHKGDIVIGNDVWIGRNAVILPGVKIGDGAIIGAYSVVAKNVPPYAIFVGNPARFVKYRFEDQELIDLLLQYQWWNLEEEEITKILPILTNKNLDEVKKFLKDQLKK